MKRNHAPGAASLTPYLTPLGAWALAFGASVGWGSFVMPGTTFLPVAGPIGTVIGIVIGALIMIVIGVNYHNMVQAYPDAGGAFTFVKGSFGYDHGFLCAWFLLLTYIAIIWANISALPLVGRSLLGNTFRTGFLYDIAGFHVYLGEIILMVAVLALSYVICLRKRLAGRVQIVMALFLIVGIIVCFFAATGKSDGTIEPVFAEQGSKIGGIITIVAMAPWAFIGFESLSHSSEELRYDKKKTLRVLIAAVLTGAVAYGLLTVLATLIRPAGVGSWPEYIGALDSYEGVQSVPTFFAASDAMGSIGRLVIGLAALGGIVTGLIGNLIAASRLLYAMAVDTMLPAWFGKLNSSGAPINALAFLLVLSLPIIFLGRTAISWIVDVTTVSAAIAYCYTSACAMKLGRKSGRNRVRGFGIAGLVLSVAFLVFYLVPHLLAINTLSTEAYLILALWSVLGFVFFRMIFQNDKKKRLGHTTVVWIALLALILLTSLIWSRQASEQVMFQAAEQIRQDTLDTLEENGADPYGKGLAQSIEQAMDSVERTVTTNSLIQVGLVVISVAFVFSIYSASKKREKQMEVEKILAEESSRAKTSFLSHMSHEIRTPMNAIIGLDNLALKEPDLAPKTRDQLEKIGASARHLLSLINDILDMSRIESGRMVLKSEPFVFRDLLEQINVIVDGQCQDKGLTFESRVIGQIDDAFIGDDTKIKQVLINILGNSVKFTEVPGTVSLTAEQISAFEDHRTLRFVMSDTGIGMDKEFLPKLFEAFSQEDATTTNRYGGTGLGMAITKNLVEMMNGTIEVESEKGVGSTFTVTVTVRAGECPLELPTEPDAAAPAAEEESKNVLEGRHVLVAEDVELNAEILIDLLELEGITAEHAENGQIALDMFTHSEPGHFDAILMDVRMPVMDGLTAAGKIRSCDHPDSSAIPIIAMTANAFEEDVQNSLQAGMNAHLSKPVDPDKLYGTLRKLIK